FLFAVKGATKQKKDGSEKLRMAAQVNLDRTKVLDDKGKGAQLSETGQSQLDAFVKNTDVDNAFGRTLDHALGGGNGAGGTEMAKRMGDTGHIKPVLEVRSTRSKFLMKLEGGTAIDFSADHAEGFLINKETGKPIASEAPPAMYSFELGVGHPSLTASATASGGGGGGSGGSVARVVEMHNKTAKIDKGEA